jgi:hypothetical protein
VVQCFENFTLPREGRKRACEFPGRGCAKWPAANPLSPLPEGSFLAFDPPSADFDVLRGEEEKVVSQ